MAEDSHKQELISQLAHARGELTHAARGIATSLNYPRRFRTSVRQNKASWLAGAGLTGWLLAKLPARKKKVKVVVAKNEHGVEKKIKEVTQAGLLLTVLRLVFNVARPFITRFLTEKLGDVAKTYVGERAARGGGSFAPRSVASATVVRR